MRLRRRVAALLVASLVVPLAHVAQAPGAVARAGTAASAGSAVTEEKAAAKAAKSGEPVEVTARRGERSTTRALPNGRFEVTEHVRPVRVRHGGDWVAPDSTLVRKGGVIAPKASTVDLKFSAGEDGPLVSMVRNGRRLELGWPGKLAEPRLEGDTAIYADAVVKGADLRLRADSDGFSHVLEVKTAEAARDPKVARMALSLQTPGLKMQAGAGEHLRAADAGGRGVFEAPAPLMWDSSGSTASAKAPVPSPGVGTRDRDLKDGPAEGSKQAAVKVELDAAGKQMVLVPDQAMLTAADTRLPVYIDPVWKTVNASAWAMVSSGFADQSYWKFAGKVTEGVGRCEVSKDSRCVRNQTKRVMYRMRMPSIGKAHVLKAVFTGFETNAYNCSDNRSTRLYRVSKLKYPATWNNRKNVPLETYLTSRNTSYCSKAPVEFSDGDVRDHVASAATKGYDTITFMLRAYDESSMTWWKRYHEDAALSIQYNNPPNLPMQKDMKFFPGGACVYGTKPSETPWINRPAIMEAKLSDPDTEDANKVQGQFALVWATKADGSDWETRWLSPKTAQAKSGSPHRMKMPSTVPEGTLVAWTARAWDGSQWGPWGWHGPQTACYFFYDASIPAEPDMSSVKYPADDEWHGGVGDAGAFTISDPAGAADHYDIRLNNGGLTTVDTAGGAARTVHIAPDRSGGNLLTVQARTRAGTPSAAALAYEFKSNAGRSPRAKFGLDEKAGATAATGVSAGDLPAAVHGDGAVLGADGAVGKALKLNGWTGSGYAATSEPAVADTSKSFSVSVWARLDSDNADFTRAVLSQDTSSYAGLVMMYSGTSRKWTFGRAIDGAWATASSKDDAVVGKWTHLTGTYDAATRQFQIYAGGIAGTPSSPAAERRDPAGAFNIGRSQWEGSQGRYWDGLIDDVRVYEHHLSAADAQRLAAKEPISQVVRAHWNLDEPAGTAEFTGKAAGYKAGLSGNALFVEKGKTGGAVRLAGDGGHFVTPAPAVGTSRSFSVAAWVKLDDKSKSRYAVSQFGSSGVGFELGYEAIADQWAFRMRTADGNDAGWVNVFSPKGVETGTWVHLLGVYDPDAEAGAGQVRLQVNGGNPVIADAGPAWNANGPLVIGANQYGGSKGAYWKGMLDDVRVYDRVVSATEGSALVKQHPELAGRWKLNTDGADDSGDPDEPESKHPLTLADGAIIDPDAGFAWDASPAGLLLNGTTAYAAAGKPVVDHRQSFTYTGWVRTPGQLTGDAGEPGDDGPPIKGPVTIFSQAGDNQDVFSLAYEPSTDPEKLGVWRAQMTSADVDSPADEQVRSVKHSNVVADEWLHLAVVYDALDRALSLYVNGKIDSSAENVSTQDHVYGFAAANGGLQAGRSRLGKTGHWPDAIDDIWAYQGALTAEQVQILAQQQELETGKGP